MYYFHLHIHTAGKRQQPHAFAVSCQASGAGRTVLKLSHPAASAVDDPSEDRGQRPIDCAECLVAWLQYQARRLCDKFRLPSRQSW